MSAGPVDDHRASPVWWRAVVWAFGLIAAALFAASLPAAFHRLSTPCPAGQPCPGGAISPDDLPALAELGLSPRGYALYLLVLVTVLVAVYLTVAGLLLRLAGHRPPATHAAAVLIAVGAAFPQTLPALADAARWWAVGVHLFEQASFLALVAWALTFPDGRFRPRWTVAAVAGLGAVQLAALLGVAPAPGGVVDLVLTGALAALVIGVQVHRYRRPGDPADRQRLRWVASGLAVALVALVLASIAQSLPATGPGTVTDLVVQGGIALAFMLIPLTVAAAVLRRGLWDVRASIGRAVTYGLLTLCVAVAYTTLVATVTAVFAVEHTGAATAGAGLIAVAFHPGYVRLRRSVNRLLYGDRDDPAAVLDQLRGRLTSAADPAAVLASVTQTLVRALRLPYAGITVDDAPTLRTDAGDLPAGWPTEQFPLAHQGRRVGALTVAWRDQDGPLGAADRAAVSAVADQAAVLAHGALVTHQLRESRRALVTAREEERRRLRNDLHDGLGPALSAVMLKLAAAGNRLADGPPAVRALIEDARGRLGAAVADVRRLVYGLRPPTLDEFGLPAAVEAFVRGLDSPATVTVETDGPLPELPAAVEVAAYRIALEAVTNLVRHSGATAGQVRFGVRDAALTVEVEDNGTGIPQPAVAGVGLRSMRERIAELGGLLRITAGPTGGTVVHAVLPLSRSMEED